MISNIVRIFRNVLRPRDPTRKAPDLKDIHLIRQSLLMCIEDCTCTGSQRLRTKIAAAQTPQELWLLRNDAYQLIAHRHNQSVAAERINELRHRFAGWLDPKQLVRIK